jgi:hypothetical protein
MVQSLAIVILSHPLFAVSDFLNLGGAVCGFIDCHSKRKTAHGHSPRLKRPVVQDTDTSQVKTALAESEERRGSNPQLNRA